MFPDHIEIAGQRLRLSYAHEPGDEADGVSFHIPLAHLFALPATPFDWLVPGLRAARIEALIRSLPQNLRRHCTPAAEYASALAARMSAEEGDFLDAICAHFRQMTGVILAPGDFSPEKLPSHLRPRLLLEDADGKLLAQAERLLDLQQRNAAPARTALMQAASLDAETRRWLRPDVEQWDFGDLPEAVPLARSAQGYPALCHEGDAISLQLLESAQAAQAAHAEGVRALLLAKLTDRMRDLVKTAKAKLQLAQIGVSDTPEQLARAVAERAAMSAWDAAAIRTQAQFNTALMQRGEFGREAARRLDEVCDWLLAAAALRQRLRAMGSQWPESLRDLRDQLDTLFSSGFVNSVPEAQWSRISVYLKAASIRLDRLANKPARDAELTTTLRKLADRLPSPFHPARWMIEEWRIALFAQELKAQNAPNAEKISSLLASDSRIGVAGR